jgi:hypothetical protein
MKMAIDNLNDVAIRLIEELYKMLDGYMVKLFLRRRQ